MRVAMYKRVSTEEQARTRYGLGSQVTLCSALAGRLGATSVLEFADEGVSASIPLFERPWGRRLVDVVAAGGVDVVIALDQERLFRDTIDCLATLRRWHELGVRLVLVDGGEVGVEDPDGFLTVAIRAVVGEHARLQTRQRTRRALAAAKAMGKKIGPAPLGYRNLARFVDGRKVDGGVHAVVDAEIAVVERICAMRRRGMTLRAVADELNREGVPTRRGGRWAAETVRKVDRRAVGA